MSASNGVLTKILERIARSVEAGKDPLVIFDLDYTLFDNSPRTKAILCDIARARAVEHPGLLERIEAIPAGQLPFDHSACLSLAGLDPVAIRALKPELGNRFFSSDYLHLDEPLPGAVDFVWRAARAKAIVMYLTGRDKAGMYEGTARSLRLWGFPAEGPRVLLQMKPDSQTKDWIYKASLRETIGAMGEVVGFFDNEPANANAFQEAFPAASIVLLATKHHPDPPPLRDGIATILDFRI